MALSTERIEALDVMRATLMVLGVVLHTAEIYNPSGMWLVHSDIGSPFFHYLAEFITAFRIPAFFFLSGFLSTMVVQRRGPKPFFLQRLRRIGLPLVATGLTLNALQTWLLDVTHWSTLGFTDFALRGEWVQHLWFLVNLLVYAGVLAFLGMFSRTLDWLGSMGALLNRLPFPVLLALLPLLTVFLLSLNKVGIPIHDGLLLSTTNLYTLFQYLVYFLAGCLAFVNQGLFEKFTSQQFLPLALWAVLALALSTWLINVPDAPLKTAGMLYLHCSVSCLGICAFLRFFKILVQRITPSWRYLSDASYTVYLFHQLVVACLGIAFIDLALPPSVGFILIVPLTLLITFFIHSFVIARHSILSLLFNGSRTSRVEPAALPAVNAA